MSELRGAAKPRLDEVIGWIGFRVDDIYGSTVGKVEGVYVDEDGGNPQWLFVKLGRFNRYVLIPISDAAAGAGHIWVPYERDLIRQAPEASIDSPLTQQREVELCEHYGIRADRGRMREIADRPAADVTARSSGRGSS